jgi:hypothetical protein
MGCGIFSWLCGRAEENRPTHALRALQRFIHELGSKTTSRRGMASPAHRTEYRMHATHLVFLSLMIVFLVVEVKIVIKVIFRKR